MFYNTCTQLIEALTAKCHAIILSDDASNATTGKCGDMFESTYKELSKWEDLNSSDSSWELVVHRNNQSERYGDCTLNIIPDQYII